MPKEKDKIQLKDFQLKEDTLSLYKAVKDNPKDKIEVEIGDSKDATVFQPQAKIQRWNNEVNFSLRYKDDQVTKGKTKEPEILTEGNTLLWKKDKREVHIYEKPEVGEDGGLEIEVVLKEKPISNVIEFSIETKGLDFFYQPELTPEEIEQGATRPENVVGSYAVYHKEKQGNYPDVEYKTGKFCHIYRPLITDANGNTVWGELNVALDKKLLTVTVDQKFLNEALYPIIVDPTFGYTSVGGSNGQPPQCQGTLFTSPSDITEADSISVYNSMGSGPPSDTMKMAIYRQSDMTLVANSLTSTITINSNTSGHWETFNYSTKPIISSSTPYILAFQCLTWSYIDYYYDSGATDQLYEGLYGSFTIGSTPWGSENYVRKDFRYSIYVTYTEATSGTEANAERSLYGSGKLSTNSERNLYGIGKLKDTSERGLYGAGEVDTIYFKENASDLETDDAVLASTFTTQEYTDVATDDNTYVNLTGAEQYFKYLFKEYNEDGANTDSFTIIWKGKSTLAPSSSNVYLQVYNRTSESWDTIDSDSSTNANTEFTLTASVTESVSEYYDENLVISCRVYQEV